jgi:predicted TIM-barrel fold metal-dependent hydrolase
MAVREGLPARYTIVPAVTYHEHLMGPAFMAYWRKGPMPSVKLPPELEGVLRDRQALMGTSAATDVYATNARLVMSQGWVRGGEAIGKRWNQVGGAPPGMAQYMIPQAYELGSASGYMVGTLVQHSKDSTTRYAQRIAHVLMYVEKGADGKWRITAESNTRLPRNAIANVVDTVTAASLVSHMNEAGIARGVVLSSAYDLADAPQEVPGERERVRAENDWVAAQAAAFPTRLVAFCSVEPLRDWAIDEMNRCSQMPSVRGIKLHEAKPTGGLDLRTSDNIEKLRTFFRAANERRMAIVAHLTTGSPEYARSFLNRVLPVAPDIPIQIAHMAGGGPYNVGGPDEALKVFADAFIAGNPLTKNLYFDVTGVVAYTEPETGIVHYITPAARDSLVMRMRAIGLNRILFGSDLPFAPLEPVGPAWARFRQFMPLTDDEIRVIAGNVTPYAR